ncbi:hypothetical protein U3A58_15155 [Algoriphagus sp. C2-6-M1]|uniref:hypothetical protein n=1 Tax=Algoriphagus persicinus TaxID=3108754 RepID=UPI002B3DC7D1|nr:hypothetical protein [Algoriphagus sp. C2-6-M1]MEB2781735.1 hypothetical protein [Algoriphagus sp. C2-6-M1]
MLEVTKSYEACLFAGRKADTHKELKKKPNLYDKSHHNDGEFILAALIFVFTFDPCMIGV